MELGRPVMPGAGNRWPIRMLEGLPREAQRRRGRQMIDVKYQLIRKYANIQ